MSYKVIDQTIIFDYDFNKKLDEELIKVIKLCNTIYFNNYLDTKTCIENENEFYESN